MLEDWRGIGIGERSYWNLWQLLRSGGRNALRVRQVRRRRHFGRCRVAGKLEHIAYRPPLHAARGAPRTFWIGVSAVIAIVFGVGIDNDGGCASFLSNELFDAAEVLSVTDDYDFASHIDVHLLEFVKIRRRAVVCINNVRLGVARRRHAVIGRYHAWIVLERIAVDLLAAWAVHLDSGGRSYVNADLRGVI